MRRLILVGAGHAHAQVLLEFALRPVKDVDLVLVSPFAQAPYSGMVPGWLAGHYRWQDCCIDFDHLCARANARLYTDSVVALDAGRNEITLAGGERIGFDLLSLNVGSTLEPPESDTLAVLPMRPLAALRERWTALRETVRALQDGATYRVLMVGGGAAGVESMLSAHAQLPRWAPQVRFRFALAMQGKELVPGLAGGAARRLESHLQQRGIAVTGGFSADRFDGNDIVGTSGGVLHADAVLWATGAQSLAWPAASGLATDERGFLRVDDALRSTSHPHIFAAGDCAGWQAPLPKAGVYAVRMGPVLAHNLRASIEGIGMERYSPQRRYLVLIGTGDAHAVASWGPLAWQGTWVWRWKQRIDCRFVARYNGPASQGNR